MNIYGIGTDIIEVSRVKSALEKYSGFRMRVYTDHEIAYCEDRQCESAKYVSYAQRFAAKEAVAKAFGTGLGKDIFFKDIEVHNIPSGQPQIRLSARTQDQLTQNGPFDIKISLSGIKDFAVAFAVLSFNQTTREKHQS